MLKNIFDGNEIQMPSLGFTLLFQILAQFSVFFQIRFVHWMMSEKALLKEFENKNELFAPIFSHPLFFICRA